jgi:gliding motility-associated-like protein
MKTYDKIPFVGKRIVFWGVLLSSFIFCKSFAQSDSLRLSTNFSSLCQPALFQWVVLNSPEGSTYKWNYGTGPQQGGDKFYAYFQNAGKISVTVEITFPDQTVHTITKKDFVEVHPLPVPNYYASRFKLCNGPDSVTYFDITRNSVKRSWIIDGSNYNNVQKKINHFYASSGIKQLSLVIEDKNGCKAIKDFDTVAIIYKDVKLDFNANNTLGCVPKIVSFTPTINTNGQNIASYKWEFPDGKPFSQLKRVPDSILFSKAGVFSPSLEVKMENGCTHNFIKQNYLAFGNIEEIDIVLSDTAVCQGNSILIKNSKGNLPGTFNWNISGASEIIKKDPYTCLAKYNALGKFDVFAVYDYNGCQVSQSLKNIIRVKGVKADFSSMDYYHCKFPHTVKLVNKSQTYESGTMKYTWTVIGNTISETSSDIDYLYNVLNTGYYNVMLVAKHSNGCSDTIKKQNYIRNNKILPDFDAAFKVGCINQPIEFTQSTQASSYLAPDKFKWTFYDKNTSKILGYSNETTPKFSYSDTGLYTIKMVADNGIGCKDSITKVKFIEIVNPEIAFEIPNTIICKNEVILGEGKSEPNRAKFSFFWYLTNKVDKEVVYFSNDKLKEKISIAGEYNLKFVHEINKGCRDSILDLNLVKISGIKAQIALDTFNGCVPFTVKPQVSITENYHFINKSSIVKYRWWVYPSADVIIIDGETEVPQFIFNKRGEYTINLEVINSDGCSHTISSQLISVGVIADFTVSDNIVCAAQNVGLTNISKLNPSKIEWILDKHVYTRDENGKNFMTIHYMDDSIHQVGLIANKLNYCYDTVFQNIKSIVVKADMMALESTLKCAPVYAQFKSNSKYADSLIWDFGDDTRVVTTDGQVGHIYRTNTDLTNGFKNLLIAKSNEGCSDTLFKNDYIKVLGPLPSFEMKDNVGCEPVTVSFKNTSRDFFKHYMNYDDGSPLDTTLGKKVYNIIYKGANIQEYYPKLYAIDSSGCKAVYTSPLSVIVKKNPIAKFNLSDTILCEKQSINFINKSDSISESYFYFDKNRLDSSFTELTINKAGNYQLSQIVKNRNNCFDTLAKKIVVNPVPVANFVITDTICLDKVLNFKNISEGRFPLATYQWKISNPSFPTVFNTETIKYTFNSFGPATVNLTVTDINNCSNTKLLNLQISNPADIPMGELKLVSVNFDSSIQIISNPVNYNRFSSGSFYSTLSFTPIHTFNTKVEEKFNYYKNQTDTASCFDFRTLDVCGYESAKGKKHCTMFLKVISTKAYTNQLNWTPYIGWESIDNYTIYRKRKGETNYNILATLNPSITSFLDSGLCNISYSYLIKATFNNLLSFSNTVSNFPTYVYPSQFTNIKNVTVLNNNSIKINWKASSSLYLKNYTLQRTNEQTLKSDWFYPETNEYIDKDVKTASSNYIYKVAETDKCDNKSKSLYYGKNIVLSIDVNDYKSNTHWNTYKQWQSGVKEYQLQVEKEGGFKTIYSAKNTDSAYFHNQTLEKINGPYCYRIMAISGDERDTSYSNISCVISPSVLFFPNAFSPNGDGLNEKISVKSLFVYDHTNFNGRNFRLEIFDRWGETIYYSESINEEWDGIYKGSIIQSGVYMYQLKAMGADNRSYSMKGTITIVP